ncbi:recombinase family protein [Paenibacillus aurantius]|uniref:Recombinase family protein n=1 Tax=Paenibacillus aurantius TaxID=2918900 RepID=A0AA96RG85_9BACL|nr:recombinase family protein [Paenibacillus aurantius]WNQ12058.1 recombinase family protein [Paenibacillus aurantius]
MSKIKVAVYSRVSTGSTEQKNSFDNQQHYFKTKYASDETYELVEMYSDRGETATDVIRRDGFLRMIADAGVDYTTIHGDIVFFETERSPLFEEIHITNSARFTRDLGIIKLIRVLWNKGVYIVAVDGVFNTRDDPNDFRNILDITLNQNDSVIKSKNVKKGHKRSAERGNLFGVSGLYGYDYTPLTKTLSINDKEASNVRLIFELYLEGIGEQRIANYLEEKNILTRKGQPFKRVTIRKMLTNEKYYGTLIRNRIDQGGVFNKYKTHKIRPESEWIITPDRIPAIITKEEFDKAQELRAGKIHHVSQRGRNYGKTEFSSRIVCSICGSYYVMCVDKNQYYACSRKRTKGVKACNSISLRKSYLENYIQELMSNELNNILVGIQSQEVIQLANEIIAIQDQIDSDKDSYVASLKEELTEWEGRKANFGKLIILGTFDDDFIKEHDAEITGNINKLKERIAENSKTNEQLRNEIRENQKKIKEINNVSIKGKYTREEVVGAISSLTVSRNRKNLQRPQIRCSWDFTKLPQ